MWTQASDDPGQPQCMNDTAIEMYLNRPDVQDALHVSGHIDRWTMCRLLIVIIICYNIMFAVRK
jgi:hypothetical protein